MELTTASALISYVAAKASDDVGITSSFIKVPGSSAYTTYTRELRSDALFTYILDVNNEVDTGTVIKINGGTVEYSIFPDLWIEKAITAMQIKNDDATDRVLLVIQAYPRAVSFY